MSRRACFALFAMLAVLPGACARRSPDPCGDGDAGPVVDTTLLAFLSRARAAHHAADRAEEDQDIPRARRLLTEVVSGPLPGDEDQRPIEVREVLADTHARLAELATKAGEFDAAEAHIQRGLDLAREPSYFRGHLYEVSGLMWEQRARERRERGDIQGARAASARALEALETAMKIQARVIEEATKEP